MGGVRRAVSDFEKTFNVPAGHSLLLVRTGAAVGAAPIWEHEERDTDGRLVAIYESWPRAAGGLAFVKYSPHGWVLSISGRSPRLPPLKRSAGSLVTATFAAPTAEV
jgi:hypothetical protein